MGGDAAREIHFTQCTLLNKEQAEEARGQVRERGEGDVKGALPYEPLCSWNLRNLSKLCDALAAPRQERRRWQDVRMEIPTVHHDDVHHHAVVCRVRHATKV